MQKSYRDFARPLVKNRSVLARRYDAVNFSAGKPCQLVITTTSFSFYKTKQRKHYFNGIIMLKLWNYEYVKMVIIYLLLH